MVVERDELGHVYKVQRPIYFISEVLNCVDVYFSQVHSEWVWVSLYVSVAAALVYTRSIITALVVCNLRHEGSYSCIT